MDFLNCHVEATQCTGHGIYFNDGNLRIVSKEDDSSIGAESPFAVERWSDTVLPNANGSKGT